MVTETDKNILKITSAFRNGVIGRKRSKNHCFMVCAPLVTLLGITGIACRLMQGDVRTVTIWRNHFWIELADGRVLDPTADQFNKIEGFPTLPKVYLGTPSLIHEGACLLPSIYAGKGGFGD